MTPHTVIFLLVLGCVLLLMTLIVRVRRHHVRSTLRTLEVRSQFGKAREMLMALARDGKIDVDSSTFAVFYNVQTYFLRRPEQYDALSLVALRQIIDSNKAKNSPLHQEAEEWSPEVRQMVEATGYAIGTLIATSTWYMRLLGMLERNLKAISLAAGVLRFVAWALLALAKRHDANVGPLYDAREGTIALAHC